MIPHSDKSAILLAKNDHRLADHFFYPKQDPDLVAGLVDKRRMAQLAQACGIPTPELFVPRSMSDVRAYARRARFPVMLKGIDGRKLADRTKQKMVIVRDADDLIRQYELLDDPVDPNLMIQEYIPGGDDTIWMFNGYFNERSECIAGFTGKKIRQAPIHKGQTSLGVCLANEMVFDMTKRFMKQLGYHGILDIGYRFDARDGKYKVLDVNPRIGATFRLFVDQAGWDVMRIMYLHMTGQSVPTIRAREGRKWLVEFADMKSSYRYFMEGGLNVRDWARSFKQVEEGAYFAIDDLVPFLLKLHETMSTIFQWILRKIVRRVSPHRVATASRSKPASLDQTLIPKSTK
jgi:predicted ATP-grasp superfamily ATP-dependent carboligase